MLPCFNKSRIICQKFFWREGLLWPGRLNIFDDFAKSAWVVRPRDGLTLPTCKVCQEDCRVDEFWPVQSTMDWLGSKRRSLLLKMSDYFISEFSIILPNVVQWPYNELIERQFRLFSKNQNNPGKKISRGLVYYFRWTDCTFLSRLVHLCKETASMSTTFIPSFTTKSTSLVIHHHTNTISTTEKATIIHSTMPK